MNAERFTVEVELRDTDEGGPMLHGTMLTEGRAASGGRAELFAPRSVRWLDGGVEISPGHDAPSEARAIPERQDDGRLTIATRATDALRQAVEAGSTYMSVEFHSMAERRTAGGVREILQALVVRAALVPEPEYDTTAAELREADNRARTAADMRRRYLRALAA